MDITSKITWLHLIESGFLRIVMRDRGKFTIYLRQLHMHELKSFHFRHTYLQRVVTF